MKTTVLFLFAPILAATAADRTWIGGNIDWTDGGSNINWSPTDEPDSDDRAIFNTNNSVNLGSGNTVNGLQLSSGIDLFTNTHILTVDGDATQSGANTRLNVGGNNLTIPLFAGLYAENIMINGGQLNMGGTIVNTNDPSGNGSLVIAAGASLSGNGSIFNGDSLASPTSTVINNGTISAAEYRTVVFLGAPAAHTLTIGANDSDARIDLDGTSNTGIVNVFRNQTLAINRPLSDAFNGTLTMTQNTTLEFNNPWTMSGGSFAVDNGAVAGIGGAPAGIATVSGAAFTQSGGDIIVTDADGALVLAAPFTGTGGILDNSGTLTFAANSTLENGHTLQLVSASRTIVDGATLTVNDDDFDMGGTGTAAWTLRNGAILNLFGDNLDGGIDTYDGTLTFDGTGLSEVFVNVADGEAEFRNIVVAAGAAGRINGNGGDNIIMGGNGAVAAGGVLRLNADFTGFRGAGTLTGGGIAVFQDPVVILDDTTFSIDRLDLDEGMQTFTINPGVTFTGNMNSIEEINGSSDFIVNGGTAIVSTSYTFGDTSRMVFAENGVGAVNPTYTGSGTVTFGSGSTLDVVSDGASFTADSVLQEGSMIRNLIPTAQLTLGATGRTTTFAGGDFIEDSAASGSRLLPEGNLRVTGNSRIEVSEFDWDRTPTSVLAGATLELVVGTIDLGNDQYDSTINLNGGTLRVSTDANSWIMDGRLESLTSANLQGERVIFGNDSGSGDSDLIVTDGQLNIGAPATFLSDADVFITSGATLVVGGPGTVFAAVNGTVNGQFAGPGELRVTNSTFSEATTFQMSGGTVALDGGTPNNGSSIVPGGADNKIDAVLTINAAIFEDYGFVQTSNPSELHISNLGRLEVNLDSPVGAWTLLPDGIINYTGDTSTGSFLAGSDISLNGTLNVTGDGASDARLAIGGTINILTSTEDFSLAGGTSSVPDLLTGGTINGPGALSTLGNGFSLAGFGTINAPIDFNGSSDLTASGGVLDVNGEILDMGTLRIGHNATLDLALPFDSGVTAAGISLEGGTLQGGLISLTSRDLRGSGLVTNRVVNDNTIAAQGGALVLDNSNSDYDGSSGTGTLYAQLGNLTLNGTGLTSFEGTIRIDSGRTFRSDGLRFIMSENSTLDLNGGRYESTETLAISGALDVSAPSIIDVGSKSVGFFGSTSLGDTLILSSFSNTIHTGATFTGSGVIHLIGGANLELRDAANIGVTLVNEGQLTVGLDMFVGNATVAAYEQRPSGVLSVEIQFPVDTLTDTLTSTGPASLDGGLIVALSGAYTPQLGDDFLIINAPGGYTGTFSSEVFTSATLPSGLKWTVDYRANSVVLVVENETGNEFADYIAGFNIPNPADRTRGADPDGDGDANLTEFALNGNPTSGGASGKCAFGFNDIGTGDDVFTFTVPIRDAATLQSAGIYLETAENLRYDILSSEQLATFEHAVIEVTGPFATAIKALLPALDSGWSYRTFRHSSPVPASRHFFRLKITDTSP